MNHFGIPMVAAFSPIRKNPTLNMLRTLAQQRSLKRRWARFRERPSEIVDAVVAAGYHGLVLFAAGLG
jgi:hypothetical protein